MKNLVIETIKGRTSEMVVELFEKGSQDEMVKVCVVNAIVNSDHPQKAEMLVWLLK